MSGEVTCGWFNGGIGRAVCQRGTWLLLVLFLLITLFQYAKLLENLTTDLGLTRYALERILYLLPIIWAGLMYGWRGGAVVAALAVACMLPRAILHSPVPEDAVVETIAVFVVGNLASYSLESLRRERERRSELETAQNELRSYLRMLEENQKRLAALNQTSSIISQSLDLSQVLENAITCVVNVMAVDVVRIYTLDDNRRELLLAAHRGVSEGFIHSMRSLRVGEGFNGRVAQSGKPLYVEDAFEYPDLAIVVRQENIRSQLIVPLVSKGEVVGTLAVAMRSYRRFEPDEVDLLTAIGNQIGVAVENARLYLKERETALEQVERYRGLFESAHDAVWLHDEDDNIIGVNRSCVRLTGYSLEDMSNLKASDLFCPESLEIVREMEQGLLGGHSPSSLGELKLIRKDGSEAYVQVASSIVSGNGHRVIFQWVARDVTEEKRMQENLRFLVRQITWAQEEERKRIAKELHDDTVQAMLILARQIDALGTRLPDMSTEELSEDIEELHQEADFIMQGVQRISQDLRPATLDRLGLLPAVEWLATRAKEYSGLDIDVTIVGGARRLSDEAELALFRIVQEALRNVWKHSEAARAEVTVEFGDHLTKVTVRDDGKGFDAPKTVADLPRYGKLGLAGMKERAELVGGTLEIISAPGKGTGVIVELPT